MIQYNRLYSNIDETVDSNRRTIDCDDIYIYIYIYIYSLIADSSDKGSDSGQKNSNIESTVTLQMLSTVDSKGTNIGARKMRHHNLPTIVRNGRFVRPITEHGDILDNSCTKWTLAVSVRNVRRIRNVESSNSLWAVFVSFAFYRVLFRPRILFKSNRLLIVLRLKPYVHSRFRKTHRLIKGIENIKQTSARRFMTRRSSSRCSRSRRLDCLDDLSSIYLGDRYVFSPLSSFA